MTKKQRKYIYLRVADKLASKKQFKSLPCDGGDGISGFVCDNLNEELSKKRISLYLSEDELKVIFPEFFLFKPKNPIDVWSSAWWSKDMEGLKERVLALLFCAEMCK